VSLLNERDTAAPADAVQFPESLEVVGCGSIEKPSCCCGDR
jgi:hypothetical protein